MTTQDFQTQLNYYKANLLGLYKQKVKLISDRENLRFQYLTAMKSQFGNIVGQILTQISADKNAAAYNLFMAVLAFLQSKIPMTDLSGVRSDGWAFDPGSPGGNGDHGIMAPTENLITNNFDTTPTYNKPAYQLYTPSYWDTAPLDDLVAKWFVDINQVARTPYSQVSTEVNGAVDPLTGDTSMLNSTYFFSVPMSLGWLLSVAVRNTAYAASAAANLDYINQLMQKKWSGGSFVDIIQSMRSVFKQIVSDTISLLHLQVTIDAATADLNAFVNTYSVYAGGIDVNQVIQDLQTQADQADVPPPAPVQDPTPVIATTVPVDNSTPAPAVSSVSPTMIVLAALGGFLLLKGKS